MTRLADATSPEAAGAGLVLVPLGSIEQHGPHLPLDTDTAIAEAVARGVAEQLPGAWVAPAIAYGSSGEHQSFAGTASVGTAALTHQLVELVRSLRTWAERVVVVNAHGGNVAALEASDEIGWVPCATEAVDLHAGYTETSLMLHLRPGSVRLELAEAGNTQPLNEILPVMMTGGVAAVSPNGVLGDPASATAAEGERVLKAMVAEVVERLS
ncbi:mycofactocin biosynthesis peptidyl-dipeptidase MftE [Nocardioides sp. YIM 152315]|uniref:mycofactocin biosynthesis peptidyl-dipeptidase MftE n=1 Tax=Nocardioides sp. YIM 152315 TaxID=3031760 RepID=UPI0023DB8857|nr:mycofactocin biosynthesis peptidyl-dipeptidase MftE [Nocardioides sp. YIM 152315]MDF1605344.1 mycofactocin biosynthesis peptidyl-dipeptidase MftE [Nocardioides sp. YIM 152315]